MISLVQRGSSVEFLYAEISNPFDGQALGWDINTEWIREYDDPTRDDSSDGDENGTGGEAIDMEAITLWNNIMNSKIYESVL